MVSACEQGGMVVFGILAGRLGPHWALEKSEAHNLGLASARVIEKWLPDILEKWDAEIGLAIALGAVVIPRLLVAPQAVAVPDDTPQSD